MASMRNVTDLTDALFYKPTTGDTLLTRKQIVVYNIPGDEGLYAIQETYLVGFDWIQMFSYVINSDVAVERTEEVELGLSTTQGRELSTEFGLTAAFKGIGFSMNQSSKTFTSTETSERHTVTQKFVLPPRSSTYAYQRKYKFRTYVWYINDAWAELSRVGGWSNYNPTFSETTDEIMSQDYYIATQPLYGNGYFDGRPRDNLTYVNFKWTRQFQNCTKKAKDRLLGLASRNLAFISGYNARILSNAPYVIPEPTGAEDLPNSEASS